MLPAALSGEPVCHCGHKAEWPSGSGLSNQQGPAGWPGTQGGVSSHPGTPWVPGALHAPEEFCLAQSPGSCLPVWSGASHTAQLCRPSLHHPFRLSLCVVHGGQDRRPHAGVLCLPTHLSAWALPGQGGWGPGRAGGERGRDPRSRPCLRGTTDLYTQAPSSTREKL